MLKKYIRHFSALFNMDFHLFDVRLKEFAEAESTFCSRCPHPCDYRRTHLYGCYEAMRWDNKYIYYCPMDFIFIAVSQTDEFRMLSSGVIAGPMLIGEPEDYEETYALPHIETATVNDLAEILSAVFSSLNQVPQNRHTAELLNALYSELEVEPQNRSFPMDTEKRLQAAIAGGDGETARAQLNKLLGEIFFRSNGDFATIKTRVLEILVLLSRSAIEGGADAAQILNLNDNYRQEIEQFRDVESLSFWLSGVVNRFVSYVFEFEAVKHADILRKVIRYIKTNYRKKITLDEIAEHVYMSKSYVSKIFNEEMNMSLSAFINKVRIDQSKHLLANTSLSIAEIANLTGFGDQSYFTKQFKAATELSPKRFREKRIR